MASACYKKILSSAEINSWRNLTARFASETIFKSTYIYVGLVALNFKYLEITQQEVF